MKIQRRVPLTGVGSAVRRRSSCLGGEHAGGGPTLDEQHSIFESLFELTVRAVSAETSETTAAGERRDVGVVVAHARGFFAGPWGQPRTEVDTIDTEPVFHPDGRSEKPTVGQNSPQHSSDPAETA
ncbi:hypothetical protein [Natronorubrum thiooxidans]|uniref:Uncharacterized protein n=1 Tax=Natronorubrum thiooxidans TaxID=308853 RepID=A0A1N7E0A1_9EURY|nr:hypothetical protein [Natronorubrum thiooxidans]SIR81466.1 hypothetical protein SAMN05421752_10381 [Natronorubrum thiooxidans]